MSVRRSITLSCKLLVKKYLRKIIIRDSVQPKGLLPSNLQIVCGFPEFQAFDAFWPSWTAPSRTAVRHIGRRFYEPRQKTNYTVSLERIFFHACESQRQFRNYRKNSRGNRTLITPINCRKKGGNIKVIKLGFSGALEMANEERELSVSAQCKLGG